MTVLVKKESVSVGPTETKEEQHAELSAVDRAKISLFLRGDEEIEKYLRETKNLNVSKDKNGNLEVWKDGDTFKYRVDPNTGALSSDIVGDAADWSRDALQTGLEAAAFVYTGGGSLVARAALGSAITSTEDYLFQRAGVALGVREDVNLDAVKQTALMGAAMPAALHTFLRPVAKAAATALESGAGKMAAEAVSEAAELAKGSLLKLTGLSDEMLGSYVQKFSEGALPTIGHSSSGGVIGGGLDLTMQTASVVTGQKESIDWSSVGENTLKGAVMSGAEGFYNQRRQASSATESSSTATDQPPHQEKPLLDREIDSPRSDAETGVKQTAEQAVLQPVERTVTSDYRNHQDMKLTIDGETFEARYVKPNPSRDLGVLWTKDEKLLQVMAERAWMEAGLSKNLAHERAISTDAFYYTEGLPGIERDFGIQKNTMVLFRHDPDRAIHVVHERAHSRGATEEGARIQEERYMDRRDELFDRRNPSADEMHARQARRTPQEIDEEVQGLRDLGLYPQAGEAVPIHASLSPHRRATFTPPVVVTRKKPVITSAKPTENAVAPTDKPNPASIGQGEVASRGHFYKLDKSEVLYKNSEQIVESLKRPPLGLVELSPGLSKDAQTTTLHRLTQAAAYATGGNASLAEKLSGLPTKDSIFMARFFAEISKHKDRGEPIEITDASMRKLRQYAEDYLQNSSMDEKVKSACTQLGNSIENRDSRAAFQIQALDIVRKLDDPALSEKMMLDASLIIAALNQHQAKIGGTITEKPIDVVRNMFASTHQNLTEARAKGDEGKGPILGLVAELDTGSRLIDKGYRLTDVSHLARAGAGLSDAEIDLVATSPSEKKFFIEVKNSWKAFHETNEGSALLRTPQIDRELLAAKAAGADYMLVIRSNDGNKGDLAKLEDFLIRACTRSGFDRAHLHVVEPGAIFPA